MMNYSLDSPLRNNVQPSPARIVVKHPQQNSPRVNTPSRLIKGPITQPNNVQSNNVQPTTTQPPPQNTKIQQNTKTPPAKNGKPLAALAQNPPDVKKPILPRVYTDDEIREYTSSGYIVVASGLWDYIPAGAHIRFVKKDTGKNIGEPRARGERFKPGGFVRCHYETEDNEKMMMIESKPGGSRKDAGYISYPVAYSDIETLWKKYDRDNFIETHLIYNSLAQKKQQIDALTQQVEDLKARITTLENILKKVVGH